MISAVIGDLSPVFTDLSVSLIFVSPGTSVAGASAEGVSGAGFSTVGFSGAGVLTASLLINSSGTDILIVIDFCVFVTDILS